MNSSLSTLRQFGTAVRALAILSLVLGLVYPLALTGFAQALFPARANGQSLTADGLVVGSALIGQSFADADGTALPEWFQSRPSAAGDGYDGASSGGSNLGPENPDLIATVDERRQSAAVLEGVDPREVPPDALTASASGLDPHISPEYARLQIPRVAATRNLTESEVAGLVEEYVQGPDLGYLGEPTVNVLELNIALAQLDT